MINVQVQGDDFDPAAVLHQMQRGVVGAGALASFVGIVRSHSRGEPLVALEIEHYPGMTDKELKRIAEDAFGRWSLQALTIVHRFGRLEPGDRIVLVAAASQHREAAFSAVQQVMDYLKTQAPFWKLEHFSLGSRWVEARDSDQSAATRWCPPEGR